MQLRVKKFPKHACQHCGGISKLVETLINDEFCWNEYTKEYEPNKFSDDFDHTGNQWCTGCEKKWTGA